MENHGLMNAPERQGKITFHGDLHPDVQGKVYLLDVPEGELQGKETHSAQPFPPR